MILKGHPFGVGPGCFMVARGNYFGFTMMSHNLYGELIGDLGIPGTVVWFLFIRQIFINLFEVKKRLELLGRQNEFLYKLTMGLLISLIVRLIIGMGSHGLYYFYWYLIGAISIMCVKITEDVAPERIEDEQKTMSNYTKKKRGLTNYGGYQKYN
jgi:O-antigen ligase